MTDQLPQRLILAERVRAMHHEQVMGRIRAAGRPALRTTVPTTLQLPARGPAAPVTWVDELATLTAETPVGFKEFVQPLVDDPFEKTVREHIVEFNRRLLVEWTAMLDMLPDPPEGMAWFPVTEMNDQVDWDSNRATITYRLRPELRDV